MNELPLLLDEYLATRRALGVKVDVHRGLLKGFVAFAVTHESAFISTECVLQWATEPRGVHPGYWARRLGTVRQFARYAHAVDPRHEVPPPGLLPYSYRRCRPYLYDDTEVAELIAAARALSSTTGLRPLTYATLLGLLSVTGMRASEVLHLDRDDVDLTRGVVTVRDGKFGKSRHLPAHESTTRALSRYARRRDRLCPNPLAPAFFLAERGTRITGCTLRWTFVKLSKQIGLRGPSKSHGVGPRLHDLRHRFAVNTLLRWYRDGVDVERNIPRLATWLGHVHVSDSYWYLTATPELLQLAARRLDRTARRPLP